MTMLEEEISFPRGGGGRQSLPEEQAPAHDKSTKKKRKSSSSTAAEDASKPSSDAVKADLLFGSSKKKKSNDEDKKSSKRRKTSDDGAAVVSGKHSLLPLGGGGVALATKRQKKKHGGEATAVPVSPVIEALSFSKISKGTKLLACVREVQEEYAIVSLPNLLTAYILPQQHQRTGEVLYPLSHTLKVGQTLAVTVQKVATETIRGGGQSKRIQVSPLPQYINPRALLVGDDLALGTSKGGEKKSSIVSAANRLSRASVPVRGQILSVEDHGCVVDMGFGIRGFVSFENVQGGKGFVVLDDDEEEPDDDDQEDEEKSPLLLQKGRLYDFLVLPVSSSAKDASSTVFPLSLPSAHSFAKKTVTNIMTTSSVGGSQKSKTATTPFTLSSLTPGWLVQVKVEAFATNGLCVSFFGNVFRGALEMNHLGATLVPDAKDTSISGPEGGWKHQAATLFQKHQHFSARILAIDVPTKLVRLSIAPHVLKLANVVNPTSPLSGFPGVGQIVEDCTVVKLDPGIGALLALPPQYNYSDDSETLFSKALTKSSDLFANASFQEACHVRKVYVHISKALDETTTVDAKDSAAAGKFHKDFAPSTKHSVRILNTSHWMEGVAVGGCAPSILSAHVLTHEDLEAGKVYKQVPVSAQLPGGSVLVQLGGSSGVSGKDKKGSSRSKQRSGICGLIPPVHLFDTTSSGSSEYRQRVFQTKYATDAKVDVRVLWVDPLRKRSLVTAKKSIVQAPSEEIITNYGDLRVGQVGVGYISKIDSEGVYVTFCNKVYGKVTARSLAAELGVEDHKENYSVGDVVTCRVVKLKRVRRKGSLRSSGEQMEVDEEEENLDQTEDEKSSRREYWELTLSLRVQKGEGDEDVLGKEEIDFRHPQQIRLRPGAILPVKTMKIVELVDGRPKKSGGYIPGYAVVSIKSKYAVSEEYLGKVTMTPDVECKLPYSQLLDSFDPADVASMESLDALAKNVLKVGKKINQKAIMLLDPHKSNVDYSSGIGHMPVVSLRKSLIKAKETETEGTSADAEHIPIVPSPNTNLFVGALVCGFVAQVDKRHGAFIRFLDGMTGLVPKRSGGLGYHLYDTVVTRVRAIDDATQPPRILLEPSGRETPSEQTSFNVGDTIATATVTKINFFHASLKVPDTKSERFFLHCSNKDSNVSVVKHRKKPLPKRSRNKKSVISKSHPFYGMKTGQELKDLTVVSVQRRKDHTEIFVSDKNGAPTSSPSEVNNAPCFIQNASQVRVGMKMTGVVVGYSSENKGVVLQVGPSVKGFVPGFELSRDLNVLNDLESNVPIGAVLECIVLDSKEWYKNRSTCPFGPSHQKKLKALSRKVSNESQLFLSVLGCESKSAELPKPSNGELVIGRINKALPPFDAPSLMLELRAGFVARCCITELDEPDEWQNMPLGHLHGTNSSTSKASREATGDVEMKEDSSSESDDAEDEEDEEEIGEQGDDGYRNGEYLECRVLNYDEKEGLIDVSLRPSRIQGDLDDDPEPQVGDIVQGYVMQTNKKGCFVRLSRAVEGRSTLKELCDGYLPKPESSFPVGRLVLGKVKEVRPAPKKEKHLRESLKFQVDLDMRESTLLQDQENQLSFEDIKVGEKYKGTVQRVEEYGVFVQIQNSSISGLVHMSECSDTFIKSLEALYVPGDLVKVLVLKKDEENQKIGFSMKASHFQEDEDSDDSSVDSDLVDMHDEVEDVEMEDVRELRDDSDDNEESIDSDDENFGGKLAAKMNAKSNNSDDSSDENSDSESSGHVSANDDDSEDDEGETGQQEALDTNVGFNWDVRALEKEQATVDKENVAYDSSDDSDSDSEGDDDEKDEKSKSHKSRKRQAEKRREEQETSRREMALADGTADENPETAGDFERLLAGDPNNSELWIRYMAFFLSLADIPSARKVADKALERIEFRQEKEKLNIWTALLTLEHKFGSVETFQAAIDRACRQNNPKQVYLRACEILEKELANSSNESSTTSQVDNLYATMCRKHKSKKKVWLAHMQYLLRQSRHEDAHALMKRALLSLAPYKHTETMSKFAQMEFELGSVERGRTLFDGLILKYPKRVDLFFVSICCSLLNALLNFAFSSKDLGLSSLLLLSNIRYIWTRNVNLDPLIMLEQC